MHSFGHIVSAPGAGWQFPYNGTDNFIMAKI